MKNNFKSSKEDSNTIPVHKIFEYKKALYNVYVILVWRKSRDNYIC